MKKLVGKTNNLLPDEELAGKFSQYFIENIKCIRLTLQSDTKCLDSSLTTFSGTESREFDPVTKSQVLALATEPEPTSCELVPIPSEASVLCCFPNNP